MTRVYSVAIQRAQALRKGDRVRLIAPASPFDPARFARGVRVLERLGFTPVYDRRVYAREGFLAGADPDRAARLEEALAEPDTRAIWCIRGGYGTARLLTRLNLRRALQNPKVLIGFSDVTALLCNLAAPGGFVTFHGPVITQLPGVPPAALRWLLRLAGVPRPAGRAPLGRLKTLVGGQTHGFLMGGNLAVLASLVGTRFMPELAGSILVLEDTGEPAYRLDRMFRQLHGAGALKNVFGVVLGAVSDCEPAKGRHGARVILERAVAELGVPAVSGGAFGHIWRNHALPLGVLARLNASEGKLTILEPAVC